MSVHVIIRARRKNGPFFVVADVVADRYGAPATVFARLMYEAALMPCGVEFIAHEQCQ